MKILVSPPKNKDLFYHEAQTARKARYIISGLQLLSGTTALIGIRIYFSDWLDDMSISMQYLVMALIAFILVAPGEMGIKETWAYLFRAVLNRYSKGLNLFSLVLMGCVAIFLTSYSFYLSQHATKNSMRRAAPKIALTDTKEVSQAYNQEVKRISKEYETQRNDINKRYQELINAENDYYDNKIQANEAEVDHLRKKGWANGQRYTTKINALESKNRGLETKRSESIKSLKEKQNAELSSIESWKRSSESEAKEEKQSTKSSIQDRNDKMEAENLAFAQMFSSLIARFAAWSVILVILFTGYLEIFYYKTGIKRVVQFRSTDFQAPVFLELLIFPYVYFSRHLTNFVRLRYDKLPKIVTAPGTEDLVDHEREEENYNYYQPPKQEAKPKKEKQSSWFSKTTKEDSSKESNTKSNQSTSSGSSWFETSKPKEQESTSSFKSSSSSKSSNKRSQFYAKDQEPTSDAASLKESLAEIFKRSKENFNEQVDRTSLDDLSFSQDIDYGATIKHVDRRSGRIEYLSMDDLDDKLADLSSKMDDASEMYQDTGDPIYLASIEEYRTALNYWQTRRVELHQRMHSESAF